MITISDNPLPTYQEFGERLRINFDEVQVEVPVIDSEPRIAYQYTTAEALCASDRSTLIDAIIRSKYSVSGEFAAINNASADPEEYAEYQAFRTQAKQLADGWLQQGV